jgi:hypothetical protein
MLSSVLRSERAVQVNVEIMRAFVRLRRLLAVGQKHRRSDGKHFFHDQHAARMVALTAE